MATQLSTRTVPVTLLRAGGALLGVYGYVVTLWLTRHGSDPAPAAYERPRGFALTVNPPDGATASAMFAALAEGGLVTQPLESTFWSAAFGTLIDRFGIPWAINCEAPQA